MAKETAPRSNQETDPGRLYLSLTSRKPRPGRPPLPIRGLLVERNSVFPHSAPFATLLSLQLRLLLLAF